MGLFDYVKKWKPTSKTLGYAQMLNGFGSPVFSQFGNDVFNSDVVQQIVSCIAWEMKKLDPQHIRVNRETGDVESVEDEIQAVLRNPNQLMTTSDMIEKVIRLLYANTNAFILPTWDRHSGKLSETLGIGVGVSSGANFLGCVLAGDALGDDAVIVTVFADDNKKYLSTDYAKTQTPPEGSLTADISLTGIRVIR